jgi:hypothetical protein
MGAEQSVERVIHFWEEMLFDKGLLCLTTQVFIEETIRKLNKLKQYEEGYERKTND